MSEFLQKRSVAFGVLFALVAMALGCGQQASDDGPTQVSDASHEEHAEGDGHDHGGWWCAEHGVPEEECSRCSSKAADDFKAKGDWCEEHNRAESQCFQCDPSRAEKFVKLYEAKFGEKPPQPSE
jgi:hypothetical protein